MLRAQIRLIVNSTKFAATISVFPALLVLDKVALLRPTASTRKVAAVAFVQTSPTAMDPSVIPTLIVATPISAVVMDFVSMAIAMIGPL